MNENYTACLHAVANFCWIVWSSMEFLSYTKTLRLRGISLWEIKAHTRGWCIATLVNHLTVLKLHTHSNIHTTNILLVLSAILMSTVKLWSGLSLTAQSLFLQIQEFHAIVGCNFLSLQLDFRKKTHNLWMSALFVIDLFDSKSLAGFWRDWQLYSGIWIVTLVYTADLSVLH